MFEKVEFNLKADWDPLLIPELTCEWLFVYLFIVIIIIIRSLAFIFGTQIYNIHDSQNTPRCNLLQADWIKDSQGTALYSSRHLI